MKPCLLKKLKTLKLYFYMQSNLDNTEASGSAASHSTACSGAGLKGQFSGAVLLDIITDVQRGSTQPHPTWRARSTVSPVARRCTAPPVGQSLCVDHGLSACPAFLHRHNGNSWQKPSAAIPCGLDGGAWKRRNLNSWQDLNKAGCFKFQGKQLKTFSFIVASLQNERSPCLSVSQELFPYT